MLKPNSTVTSNLIKARELIADEKNWCRQALFRPASDGFEMQWCAVGAIYQVRRFNDLFCQEYRVLQKAAYQMGFFEPALLNDSQSHATVMRMYDRAIELSLQDG